MAVDYRAVCVFNDLGFLLVHFGHNFREVRGDLFAHVRDEFRSFVRDPDHDLATIFGGVDALDVSELLKAIDQTGSGCGRMSHLLSDIGHREIVLACKVGEQEELGKRDITPVEFVREVQDAGALRKQDEVRKAIRISLDCTS